MSLKQSFVQAASLAYIAAASAIIELKEGDDPVEKMTEYDYAVISFYNSEEWSVAVDQLMEGAKAELEKMIKSGKSSARNSLGWFRVDIEKHPELSFEEEAFPDQLVVSNKSGLKRYLHYEEMYETKAEDEAHLALIIKELTGDFVEPINCSDIQAEMRHHYDEVVYMGPKKEIEEGGSLALFEELAKVDRYNFDDQRAGFYYVEDSACRTEHDLDDDKNYIVFFNGENSIWNHIEVTPDSVNFEQLMFTLNTSIVKGTARWSQRSYSALFDFLMTGIVYLMPEDALSNVVLTMKDWRVALMAKVIEWTQENDSMFIPVIQDWDADDEEGMLIPSMANLLGATKEDLPHLYLYHPLSGKAVPYPDKLDDINNFSPELIMAWAEKTNLSVEVDHFAEEITHLDEHILEEGATDEEKAELEAWKKEEREHLEASITEYKVALKEAKKIFDEVHADLKVKNEFAEKLDEHLEVSEGHMTRIEQAIMEEL